MNEGERWSLSTNVETANQARLFPERPAELEHHLEHMPYLLKLSGSHEFVRIGAEPNRASPKQRVWNRHHRRLGAMQLGFSSGRARSQDDDFSSSPIDASDGP